MKIRMFAFHSHLASARCQEIGNQSGKRLNGSPFRLSFLDTWLKESVGKRISLCNSVESLCLCGGITQKKSTTDTPRSHKEAQSLFFPTDSFSQVTPLSLFDWKPLKRFSLNFESPDTWLKPGVNESGCVLHLKVSF